MIKRSSRCVDCVCSVVSRVLLVCYVLILIEWGSGGFRMLRWLSSPNITALWWRHHDYKSTNSCDGTSISHQVKQSYRLFDMSLEQDIHDECQNKTYGQHLVRSFVWSYSSLLLPELFWLTQWWHQCANDLFINRWLGKHLFLNIMRLMSWCTWPHCAAYAWRWLG